MWAVVGTAGRKDDAPLMSKELFDKAYAALLELEEEYAIESYVSGGAAWMDHLVVRRALNANRLEHQVGDSVIFRTHPGHVQLHLPCPMNILNNKAVFIAGKGCPGQHIRAANYYHEGFSQRIYGNKYQTRMEILDAIRLGLDPLFGMTVTCESGGGFFGRNGRVASDATDGLIAFTFSDTGAPKDGGTMATWQEHFKIHPSKPRIHVDLGGL